MTTWGKVRKLKWVSLDALSLCHRQMEPFCVPRRVAVLQQPCCSVAHVVDIGCKQPSMPCTRGQIPCCFRMTDAVERFETHNEHAATIMRALPLGMCLLNMAYSKQSCPSLLKSSLKCCKSTTRQESSGDEIKVDFFVCFVAVHRQMEPFCVPRRVAVLQQPCCSVENVVDIGCKSCTPTVLIWTRNGHWSSPNRCYTRLQLPSVAQFGLQTAAFDAMHPRSDSLLF